MGSDLVVEEIGQLDEAVLVVRKFEDGEFVSFANDDSLVQFAKKQLEFGHFLVAYQKDEPCGYICFYSNDQETKTAFVSVIAVSGYGIGRGRLFSELISGAVRIAVREGMELVMIQVDRENLHAIRIYEKLGFEYIDEENEMGVLMRISMKKLIGVMRIRMYD